MLWYSLVEKPNTVPMLNSCNLRWHKQDEEKATAFKLYPQMYLLQFFSEFLRLFYIFTTNEMELDYYHQKFNAQVASLVAERLHT